MTLLKKKLRSFFAGFYTAGTSLRGHISRSIIGSMVVGSISINGQAVHANSAIVQGSGVFASEDREVQPFSRLTLVGSLNVIAQITETPFMRVEGDNNLIGLVTTIVSGQRLTVTIKENISFASKQPLNVFVGVPAIEELALTGSGNLSIKNLKETILEAELVGSGNMALSGQAEKVRLQGHGSGNLDARDLHTIKGRLSLTGSGNLDATVTEYLTAHLKGSGNIDVLGNPARRDVQTQGSGRIRVK